MSRRHAFNVCAHCGHPIPSDEAAGVLPGKQRKIYELVRDAGTEGIDRDSIMSALYDGQANGGPLGNVVSSLVSGHINRKIKPFGVRIVGRSGPGGRYVLKGVSHET